METTTASIQNPFQLKGETALITPMLRQALDGDEARTNKILGRTPTGTFGLPEDIGWAAVYLASPAAKFVTGICLPVGGGASIGF